MANSAAHPDFQIVPSDNARRIAQFKRAEIISLYEKSLPVPPEMANEFYDFDLWECEQSKLVYALPAAPGTSRFYEWITKEDQYYPTIRVEWPIIGDEIANLSPDQHVLDIGSGAGNLLDYLRTRTKASLHGLDATPTSVEICRSKGHTAHLGMLSDLIANEENHGKFSAVIMTHLLEHVPRPIELVSEALVLLKRDGGKLFISTPHSPTLYEASGYHGKNLPPHHLTRWRASSYEHLAKRFGLKVELRSLVTMSPLRPYVDHFAFALDLPRFGRKRLLLEGIKHPIQLAKSLYAVWTRDRANGKTIGSDILGIFKY